MLLRKLYLRIWLAVVLAVAVLTLLVGWAWHMAVEPPLREVVVHDETGAVIGRGELHPHHEKDETGPSGSTPGSTTGNSPGSPPPPGRYGNGPEFMVRMNNGQSLHLHLPRPQTGGRAPFGFFWTLGLVAVAVAIAVFPIVRRLTRRLESLRNSVERWGNGDLKVRMEPAGFDEVGFLAEGFNHAADQVEALINARDALLASQRSLLANASHELRSPLTRIRMGLEFLPPDAAGAARMEIERNIVELDQLIEEILLASRLDALQADIGTIESIDMAGLVAECCSRMGATFDAQAGSVTVPGVRKLLRRVVRNLLENAQRYAQSEVNVVLRAEAQFAILEVSDRGPGVPDALKERIFEPFYRLPGASEKEGGVGLGLALVKSIVHRHGGRVACTDRDGGGATFTVWLPV